MYKILTHLHTQSPSVHRYHMIQNDKGQWVDFQSESLEEVEAVAMDILKTIGCCDLTVVEEHPFYIDLTYKEDEAFTGEEEKEEALTMLQYLGWDDLKISDHKPFEINIVWGTKPEMEKPKYSIQLSSNVNCVIEPMAIEDIEENSSCGATVTFEQEAKSFHLVINGEEQTAGIPSWIKYTQLSTTSHQFTFNGVTTNYDIQIVVD